MAFLDVITRHMPKRRHMLRANDAALKAQSDPDFKQWVLTDTAGRGWAYAAEMLVDVAPKLTGEYVLILDDDDLMIHHQAIHELKMAAITRPPAILFRGWHGDLGVLPPDGAFGRRPQLGKIGSFDFILRRDVFCELVPRSIDGGYCNDFALIDGVFDHHPGGVIYLDLVICAVMMRSMGK